MTHIIKKLNSWIKRQERITRTKRELAMLNDRELSDIGLTRSDIDRVARGKETRSWTNI